MRHFFYHLSKCMPLKNSVVKVKMSTRVGTLFNKIFQLEIIRQYSDQEGRCIIIDMKIDNKVLTLVNIYAPNKQGQPNFLPKSSRSSALF